MRQILKSLWGARRAILFYACLFAAGGLAGQLFLEFAIPEMRPMNEPLIHRLVMGALIVFVLAAAIPFVPGAEIGFALLLIFGGQAAPIVYAGMVGALILSYAVARLVPLAVLGRFARWLGLIRVSGLIEEMASTPRSERAALISGKLDGRISSAMLRNRYVVLAILLNTPGNSVLGGGGGLAFTAGISGLYRFWPYLLTVLIAVAPFPVFFYLFRA